MTKKTAAKTRLPPLSGEALSQLTEAESIIQKSIRTCKDDWDGSFNTNRALRYFQTSSIRAFEAVYRYYSSLPSYEVAWLPQIEQEIVDALVAAIPKQYAPPESQIPLIREASFDAIKYAHAVHTQKAASAKVPTTPRELLTAYIAGFPEKVKILDICWAANQHYSEWRRWLRGVLKDDSTPDKAFRALLTSGKRPNHYKNRPRPKGWK